MAENTRIYIVEDHPVVREGLASFLAKNDDLEIVGMDDTVEGACKGVADTHPDVVLLDIRLKGTNGLSLGKHLKDAYGDTLRVIVLTSFDDDEYIAQAIRCHVDGYLLKSTSADYIVEAIRMVRAGGHYMSPDISGKLLDSAFILNRDEHRRLTDEEVAMLGCVAQGMTTSELTERFCMSERTVKRRLNVVFEKLGVNNRAQAVAKAYEMGLL